MAESDLLEQIPLMRYGSVVLHIGDAPELEAFLAERIYEFNAKATGYFDGECFSATEREDSGAIRGGITGYTWGRSCYVTNLWVDGAARGKGLGGQLLRAAEDHARRRGCTLILVDTHTFQAPGFYERMGYQQQAVIQDHPVGHANVIFARRLTPEEG